MRQLLGRGIFSYGGPAQLAWAIFFILNFNEAVPQVGWQGLEIPHQVWDSPGENSACLELWVVYEETFNDMTKCIEFIDYILDLPNQYLKRYNFSDFFFLLFFLAKVQKRSANKYSQFQSKIQPISPSCCMKYLAVASGTLPWHWIYRERSPPLQYSNTRWILPKA